MTFPNYNAINAFTKIKSAQIGIITYQRCWNLVVIVTTSTPIVWPSKWQKMQQKIVWQRSFFLYDGCLNYGIHPHIFWHLFVMFGTFYERGAELIFPLQTTTSENTNSSWVARRLNWISPVSPLWPPHLKETCKKSILSQRENIENIKRVQNCPDINF